ncbi:helix-turn-helix transcriptional regulator [Actinomadura sp. 7K507]|uniref:helix-turn-helix domain-containing protein n=1 Tax=Actinomadura sp. 7K507 TaxID=2530365 RepID=UPI001047F084|nr:helix-turn-helix transcriptional regulator [Actinomadura sp. 7K507]TDC81862.1 XRE family transcriptional regulator [Actinomadura sp. 7K507]
MSENSIGDRIAAHRTARRLTQRQLASSAHVSLSLLRKVEQGDRPVTDRTLAALAEALETEPDVLVGQRRPTDSRVHTALPNLRTAIDAYDLPEDGPVRPLAELERATGAATRRRLSSQYTRLAESLPDLLGELTRYRHSEDVEHQARAARLLVSAYRAADAVAYKYGYYDLSARLVELMRASAEVVEDPALLATAAYVRTEVFFASHNLTPGLRLLERALDNAPPPNSPGLRAAVGALHMRAAVVAARLTEDIVTADEHFEHARRLAESVPEGVYNGTAFGPVSLHVHEVALAVERGDAARAAQVTRRGAELSVPLERVPEERRSHYYIDVARAQLWLGRREEAFRALQAARRIAPQHTREHPFVRDVLVRLLRLHASPPHALVAFAEWARAI